jgi:hypothetical protein
VVLFSNVCGFLARAPSVALTPLQIAEEIGAEVENIITAEEGGGGAERTSSCNVEYYGSTLLPDLRPEKEASQLRRDHLLCIIIIIIIIMMCLLHHHRRHHHHHVPSNLGGV